MLIKFLFRFSYKLFPFVFFSQRVLYYFIGITFFGRTEAVAWRCSVEKVSKVSRKNHHKTPVLESFLSVKLQDRDL